MTGQGGGLVISTQVQIVDLVHILLFVYNVSRNPTWLPSLFRWMPMFVFLGVALQFIADHSKYLFRENPRNDGKIYMDGAFRIVRHPNFLGFFIWRVAFATACGGLILGAAVFAMCVNLFVQTSVPGLERYLSAKYGRQWDLF
jgi:steroid 5-alpha reductase family enzyme